MKYPSKMPEQEVNKLSIPNVIEEDIATGGGRATSVQASTDDASASGRWAFVITSPTERRPTARQRTLMRRHIMRDIGYSRRRHQQYSVSNDETTSTFASDYLHTSEDIAVPVPMQPTVTALVTVSDESRWLLDHSTSFRTYPSGRNETDYV